MANSITVNIKFFVDEKQHTTIGLVTHSNGSWKGCRPSDQIGKTKVVVLGSQVQGIVIPGVLYRTVVIPMNGNKGFVATSAVPVQFSSTIKTEYDGDKPILVLSFGGKKIIYDPLSSDPKYNSINDIVTHILHRYDIADAYDVSNRFNVQAIALSEYVKQIKQ